MNKHALKEYIENIDFIRKMDEAFSDLRADYELSMDTDNKKIEELLATHVDVKNQLSNLSTYSLSSSGVVSGLRGTGKTHLLLLARHRINENCFKGNAHRVFCIYINIKRLSLPETFTQETFNRVFSIFLYNEIFKQLAAVLEQLKDQSLFEHFCNLFDGDRQKNKANIKQALLKLLEFKEIARLGNTRLNGLSTGTVDEQTNLHEIEELASSFQMDIGKSGIGLNSEWTQKDLEEIEKRLSTSSDFLNYLNINTVHDEIIELLKLLQLKGFTFYVDEWEKISYDADIQKFLSFYIDRILDDPIYFWISVVPHRGDLYSLVSGADLQHFINLDENLIYENSAKDKELCINYFKQFVNLRLMYYFNDPDINVNLLFNNNHNFEKLVLASMGNSRDFGTMLLTCWSEFRAYRTGQLAPGRPYQYISEQMVISAIKNNGEKKISNINNLPKTLKVWNDLENFCTKKHSSHLAIEESRDNIDALSSKEFSDLIYHRLLHLRKSHVPAKDTRVRSKLSIYALNYSSTYDLHSNEKKFQFVTDYNMIHNRVRRYIYNPIEIVKRLQIQDGELFPCVSCGERIMITRMIAAWENNSCPFCGRKIRNE